MVRSATFSPGKALAVTAVELTEYGYEVDLEDRRAEGFCPACGACSTRSHGWHRRTLQDLLIAGRPVSHRLALRRWRCVDKRCSRRHVHKVDFPTPRSFATCSTLSPLSRVNRTASALNSSVKTLFRPVINASSINESALHESDASPALV